MPLEKPSRSVSRVVPNDTTETFRVMYLHKASKTRPSCNSQYLVSRSKQWWSDTFTIHDSAFSPEVLFSARCIKGTKKMNIWSVPYEFHTQIAKPTNKRGMYSFDLQGNKFCWDYEPNQHLRCFDAREMTLVAQVFWGESLSFSESKSSKSSKSSTSSCISLEADEYVFDVVVVSGLKGTQCLYPMLTLTSLMILKPWKN
ncbi:hypothetical protein K493DRAFT_33267 [Basidiobolus meristosporus CBS 931.73]|uniref:Uncharacterized protein n=1 Tax=Basidiobolus meristosporus CBS 931.73 TaxID=1314790 RepID=A0A1Y1Y7C7_9FUNG|nr:hypothetical protein K493DRAFT_33267 [Basidiobolus meristosporus CBS 931.73]|eukprot:ORX93921.1 hypothetical protein K493DRAFT_33267 [Basidiobolus meristosporus CBS 931.73]